MSGQALPPHALRLAACFPLRRRGQGSPLGPGSLPSLLFFRFSHPLLFILFSYLRSLQDEGVFLIHESDGRLFLSVVAPRAPPRDGAPPARPGLAADTAVYHVPLEGHEGKGELEHLILVDLTWLH